MGAAADYKAEHWTTATAEAHYKDKPPVVITVNDRAATRQAIIAHARLNHHSFIERSSWGAHKAKPVGLENDWNYTKIAIHQAGRSFACGAAASQLRQIQDLHQSRPDWPDIGYHYAVACTGEIYEGRDIRFKGTHLHNFNTGAIGVVLLENLADGDERHDFVGFGMMAESALGIAKVSDAPEMQRDGVKRLVEILKGFFKIAQLGGHREFPHQDDADGRICPGNHGIKLVTSLRSQLGLAKPA